MKQALEKYRKELEAIKEAGTWKGERIITTPQKSRIDTTQAKKVVNMCANNYLGLSNHPALIQAARESYDQWGFGLSSVRFICGTQSIHKELEEKLADMGVEVHRWMNVTNQFLRYGSGQKNLRVKIQDLSQYDMGPTSTANIWYARECAERGYDGLVHIKSSGCTPEIDVMPVLQTISTDYKIPVLYLTYDAQTSDVGLMTRLEAFYDMIDMRKKVL